MRPAGIGGLRTRCARWAILAVAFLSMLSPSAGWAWGKEGHRLTGLIAEQYLTPAARAKVAELLGSETLADVAPWADSYRTEHPETGKWHYVNIPSSEAKYDRDRDCPMAGTDSKSPWRDCVTDRILFFEQRLRDTSLSREERAIALKFLVHFIGDIHQPFHALADARGGNDIAVTFLGSGTCGRYNCNLHGVWDTSLIDDQGLTEAQYRDRLREEIKQRHWDQEANEDPARWANRSHALAVKALVPTGSSVTEEYVRKEATVVDEQLALAGLRLAHVLNSIL
jgi:S1/P1 Nuclease